MIRIFNFFVLIIPILISIYTISYGIWTWNTKNRLGAVMVFILALVVVGLPVYELFFIE